MNPHLAHLSVQWDGREPQVPEHQGCSLGIVAGTAEDHKGVASQLVQNVNQVSILSHKPKTTEVTEPERKRLSAGHKHETTERSMSIKAQTQGPRRTDGGKKINPRKAATRRGWVSFSHSL